jgi:hypothetical protein
MLCPVLNYGQPPANVRCFVIRFMIWRNGLDRLLRMIGVHDAWVLLMLVYAVYCSGLESRSQEPGGRNQTDRRSP